MKKTLYGLGLAALIAGGFYGIHASRIEQAGSTSTPAVPEPGRVARPQPQAQAASFAHVRSLHGEPKRLALLELIHGSKLSLDDLWDEIESTEFDFLDDRRLTILALFDARVNSTNQETVLSRVLEKYGPGKFRDLYASAVLRGVIVNEGLKNVEQSLALIDRHCGEMDQNKLRADVAASLKNKTTCLDALAFFKDHPAAMQALTGDEHSAQMLTGVLSPKGGEKEDFDSPATWHNALSFLESQIGDPRLRRLSAITLAGNYSMARPFIGWDILQTADHGSTPLSDKEKEMSKDVVLGMVQVDPARAMQNLGSASTTDPSLLRDAAAKWLELDSRAAKEWFANQPAGNPAMMDSFQSALAGSALQSGSLADAKAAVNQITDPALKAETAKTVLAKETDLVRDSAAKDPAATVDSFVSGAAGYSPRLMEQAMTVWIEQDPEKANQWYEGSRSKLPAGQAQYVAAAYAGSALKAGDVEAARQWSEQIADNATRKRVEANIAAQEAAVAHP